MNQWRSYSGHGLQTSWVHRIFGFAFTTLKTLSVGALKQKTKNKPGQNYKAVLCTGLITTSYSLSSQPDFKVHMPVKSYQV